MGGDNVPLLLLLVVSVLCLDKRAFASLSEEMRLHKEDQRVENSPMTATPDCGELAALVRALCRPYGKP